MRALTLLASLLLLGCTPPAALPEPTAPQIEREVAPVDPDAQRKAYARAVRALLVGEHIDDEAIPELLRGPATPVHVGLYGDSGPLNRGSSTPAEVEGQLAWHTLEAALGDALSRLSPEQVASVRSVSLEFAHDYIYYDALDAGQWDRFRNYDAQNYVAHFGLLGDAVGIGETSYVRPPSEAIATNQRFDAHYNDLRKSWRLSPGQMQSATFASFAVDAWLVTFDPLTATPTVRGNGLVEPESVDAETVSELATHAASWLLNNIDERGALRYGYHPSDHVDKPGNNAIRQWNATRALLLWAATQDDPDVAATITRNVEHNLAETFRFEDELGIVERNGKVKLGSLALAGLALLRHDQTRWAKQIVGLRATVDTLFAGGRFTSFYRGSDKEYWDFYPGEALLFWAELYALDPSPATLRDYRLAFEFYSKWHLMDRLDPKPAFAPWHILANVELLGHVDPSLEPVLHDNLEAFCFQLADSLLIMQQGEADGVAPDEYGRFYAPQESWGVASAATTGVYTWSLVSAFELAREAGELERALRYRLAVLAGLRNLMQLQFVDEVDMFYVPVDARDAVRGGLRTNVTDNRIRVDNVHYALLAAMAALEAFGPDDFHLSR